LYSRKDVAIEISGMSATAQKDGISGMLPLHEHKSRTHSKRQGDTIGQVTQTELTDNNGRPTSIG